VAALTLDEKISLLAGRSLWETVPIERLGVPPVKVTDGPSGARGADANHGPTSTSFPVGAAMGATFDPDLIAEVGRALAHEARDKGASVLLGPTVNIPRVPVAGRNFECYSEDPLLSGTLAAAYVDGLQGEGVAACIKHFVCNDQEHERHSIDARCDERTLREIYLEPFRIAIQEAGPWAVMSAYNTVNGVTASEHPMLDEVLRAELGFDGLVMSDWYGTYGPGVAASGLDLEMPGPARWASGDQVEAALASGAIDTGLVDRKVGRLLTLIERTGARELAAGKPEVPGERAQDRDLARRVAVASVVLLANDGTLPLVPPPRLAVIGDLAAVTPHQGGGSSAVNPHRTVSILEGLTAAVGAGTDVVWSRGCSAQRGPRPLDPASLTHGPGEPGLRCDYFTGPALEGDPVRTATTAKSLLTWFGPGDGWIDHRDFSLRLSGRFTPAASGVHTFSVSAVGRARVSMDSDVVVDGWPEPSTGPDWRSWERDLTAGVPVELVVEYGAVPGDRFRLVRLGCEPPGTSGSITGDIRAAAKAAGDIRAAAEAAGDADVAVVVVGLTPEWESEGFDRPDLKLPGEQDRLIAEVAAAQPKTVVVLVAGSPVEMAWRHDVAAIVQAWYGGQEVGHAVADVLLGAEDPGGRLPVTFPAHSRQHPGLLNYPGEAGQVRYGEGVYVGYRAYDRLGLEPLFGFGHGLSYTTFALDSPVATADEGGLVVAGSLANTGDRPGSEVIQVYASIAGVERRLIGFCKLALDAGQSAPFRIPIAGDRLRWWDPGLPGWAFPSGRLALRVEGTFTPAPLTVELT
jgi:beta-glucosidase